MYCECPQELSAQLLRGFAECLELEDAEIVKLVEDEFVGLFFEHLLLISSLLIVL